MSEKPSCYACGKEIPRDHLGIKCPQGHDLCREWAKDLVKMILSDPETMIPAKWQMWKIPLSPVTVEIQLDQAQLEMYLMYTAIKQTSDTEKVVSCPFCKYFEIWLKTNSANFFYCDGSECSKTSCSIWHKEVSIPKDGYIYLTSNYYLYVL